MDPPQETPSPECWDRGLGSQNPTGYEVGRERILPHKLEFPRDRNHCCPRTQGRRSKTSKEGNRESEGPRRRATYGDLRVACVFCPAVGMIRFRRIKRSEGVLSVGNGIIFRGGRVRERRPDHHWASAV